MKPSLSAARSAICLGLLTLAVAYAVVMHGGDETFDSSVSFLLVGLAAVVGSFSALSASSTSAGDRVLGLAAVLFPVYVAFQLVPLPLAVLRVVSPARAEIADGLAGVMAAPHFAPLNIAPPTTWVYLARIAAYALIFLVVRQIARQSRTVTWGACVPLILIALAEAMSALPEDLGGPQPLAGTYFNKNHFASLLAMILPFCVMYAVAVLSRGRQRGAMTAFDALQAFALLAAAAALFVAIIFSLSKGGFSSTLASLAIMSLLGFGPRLSGGRRWSLVPVVAVVVAAVFVFLTPLTLVEQFGGLASADPTEGRWPILKDAVRLLAAYPVFGCGLGNFFPGILRYQTSGLNLAWTAAHNDYIQLLSELGFVGFLIPAVLLGGVFVRAARTALSGATDEVRYFGLACVGSLAAVLLHSVSEFNTYILANAMVLAWVSGLSAGVPRSIGHRQSSSSGVTPLVIRGSVVVLGCLLCLYAVGWLAFVRRAGSAPAPRSASCRFGICDTNAELRAQEELHGGDSAAVVPLDLLLEFLKRDPAAPYRWQDLGEGMQAAGRTDTARYAFARSIALSPLSPPTLLRAADFNLDLGETSTALALVSRSLRAGSDDVDKAAFANLMFRKVDVDVVLRSVSFDRRSSQTYFRQLIAGDDANAEGAAKAWSWMVVQGYADDRLTREYTEFLMGRQQQELAWQAWVLYASERAKGYPETNRIFNGDFESDPAGSRFDWRIESASGTAIDFDRSVSHSGGRSLRVQFDGTANPSEVGVRQSVFLQPGRYRLSAYVRTKELSTDEGISLRIVNEGGRVPIDAATEKLRGTNDWTLVERMFDAPPGGGLVNVSLTRKPSLKFDNLLRGTIWLDQVSIRPEVGVARPHS